MDFKAISISDTHFGLDTYGVENADTGLSTRAEDGFNAFDQVIEYAIKNKIKYCLHSGDVFNNKTPSMTVVNAFYERIKRLSDAEIMTIILSGNHDNSRLFVRKSGLDLMSTLDLPNIIMTRGNSYHDLGQLQIVTVSYWNSLDDIQDVIEGLAKQVDWSRPAILMGHLQIQYANFPGSFKHDLPFVPLSALTSHPWSLVQLGHIHLPQIINENPKVFYVGSLVRCSASEEKDKKGFWVFDVNGTKVENLHQEEVNCLRFVTFRGTISELKNLMEHKTPDLSMAIVRLIINETDEPIDDGFIKEKFGNAFKCIISKEAKEKTNVLKISASDGLTLQAYVNNYFENDTDKDELFTLIEELRILEDVKGQA